MLRLPPFTYHAPRSLDEAVQLLTDYGSEAMVVAGGTDLYPKMKRRQMTPSHLVALRGLRDLYGVRQTGDGAWQFGALATLTQVGEHTEVSNVFPALTHAAGQVSTPQLRNAGTIGGNLCVDTRCTYYDQTEHWRRSINYCLKKDGEVCWVAPGSPRCWAVSSSDTAPVMVALGAQVHLVGPSGERTEPVAAIYGTDGIDYLAGKQANEIITSITLPVVEGTENIYLKLRRRGSFDFPILGVAVALRREPDGTVRDARVVLGAVESFPLRVPAAEVLLNGQRLTPEVIEAAAAVCRKPARPLDNTDLTLYYRSKMVPVFVARALRRLARLETAGTDEVAA
ncbi:MAG TPA: 4-hydroxybenzoyl-CoA reductase [Chloroflexi bacterium]|nr:4-hydroxybenzoyl-CoA reductase [Chloroflexota bacterium]